MSESFAEWLRSQVATLWDRILTHPFLHDLAEGILPRERFAFFLAQDYYYLEAFGRALAIGLAKAPTTHMRQTIAAGLAVPLERPHHRHLAELIGVSADRLEGVEPAPTTLAYANFLLTTASLGSFGELTAALLPCTWTYEEIGTRLLPRVVDPVYHEWVKFYVSAAYRDRVRARIGQINELDALASEADRRLMLQAFTTASRYEYSFWQMAYEMESWPAT